MTQAWWRHASKIDLLKKKFVDVAKCIIFNLQLLPFMPKNEAINYYYLIKDAYSDSDNKFDNFFEYFESRWLSLKDNYKSKFDFELWSYYNKFNFKGNKNKLISD